MSPASSSAVPVMPVSRDRASPLVAGSVVEGKSDEPLSAPSSNVAPARSFFELIPHEFARRHLILSAGTTEGDVTNQDNHRVEPVELLRTGPATDPLAVFNVGVRLGRPVRAIAEDPEELAAAIDAEYARYREARSDEATALASNLRPREGWNLVEIGSPLGDGSENPADVESALRAAIRDAEQDLLNVSGKSPAVRLVDLILFEAVRRNASDVHVQPTRDRTLVRYRLDGALHTSRELPGSLAAAVISRIKVMGRMDVAEQRAPQDGRASVTIGGRGNGSSGANGARRIDLRISTLPNTYGERVVIRLLDPSRSPHTASFSALGMPDTVERAYLAQVARTHGIVLSTGPTGSGKTTTLYATLSWVSASHAGGHARGCELNIMTVEDPVEYDLTGVHAESSDPARTGAAADRPALAVSQTQVDVKKGVTFAAGLRHILRQDPDVIMVGEIRDEETARISVQASLTGHLVLSTLHTNDAPSAVARLIDLKVEPFLVSSSLSAVLAQRLVRTLHGECGGRGCAGCMEFGFKGRRGVFELLVMDDRLRELVGRRATAAELRDAAIEGGMVTLKKAGEHLVRRGITTAAEVARVIEAIDELEQEQAA